MTKMISIIKIGSMIKTVIHLFFVSYTLLLFARIILSWVPNFSHLQLARFVFFYTEPYLSFFRRIIPPIGGMLDLSPLFAFFTLRFLENLLLRFL